MGIFFLLIVILCGIGFGGYYYWQQQRQAKLQAISSELKEIEQSIIKAEAETASLKNEMTQITVVPETPGKAREMSTPPDQNSKKVSPGNNDREDLRKLFIRCKGSMPPDMVMLERLVERLELMNPPPEIELAGRESVSIGAELNHPSPAGKVPDLPEDCMKSPPCSVCRGQPPEAGCAACGGTGFQTEETIRVTSRGSIRTRKPLLPVFDRESALAAYRKRIAMLELWVEAH